MLGSVCFSSDSQLTTRVVRASKRHGPGRPWPPPALDHLRRPRTRLDGPDSPKHPQMDPSCGSARSKAPQNRSNTAPVSTDLDECVAEPASLPVGLFFVPSNAPNRTPCGGSCPQIGRREPFEGPPERPPALLGWNWGSTRPWSAADKAPQPNHAEAGRNLT